MASYYVNLPAPRVPRNAMLDFSGVNSALDAYQGQQNRDRQFGMQEQQLGMQKDAAARAQAAQERQWKREDVQMFGQQAAAIDRLQGPERARAWQMVLQKHGGQGLSPEEMDPMTGPKLMMAQAGQFRDPRDDQMKDLDLQYRRAQINQANSRAAMGGEMPSNIREWIEYQKMTPEGRAEYLRMKRADKVLDLGTSQVIPNQANPSAAPSATFQKDVAGEEREKAKGRAAGDFIANLGKYQAKIGGLAQQGNLMRDEIGRAKSLVTSLTTGIAGGILAKIPGSDANKLRNRLQTIRANVGFDRLQQMREESPTGGALGQVAVQELQYLQSVFGALEQAQNAEELLYNLNRLEQVLASREARFKAAYEMDAQRFGAAPQQAAQPTPAPAPSPAEGWSARRLD